MRPKERSDVGSSVRANAAMDRDAAADERCAHEADDDPTLPTVAEEPVDTSNAGAAESTNGTSEDAMVVSADNPPEPTNTQHPSDTTLAASTESSQEKGSTVPSSTPTPFTPPPPTATPDTVTLEAMSTDAWHVSDVDSTC